MLKTWSKDPELRPCFAQICTELQLCIANRRYISLKTGPYLKIAALINQKM